jgi:hypothetical protein
MNQQYHQDTPHKIIDSVSLQNQDYLQIICTLIPYKKSYYYLGKHGKMREMRRNEKFEKEKFFRKELTDA